MSEREADQRVDADTTAADADADADAATDADARPESSLDIEVDSEASGPAAFMQALRVGRNARWGVAVGVAVTVVVFVVFVVIPGTIRSPLWYSSLAFVLALSTAGLVAAALTLVRAVRLSRNL
jgi:hypothetical protein